MYSCVLILVGLVVIMFPIMFAIGPIEGKHTGEEFKLRQKRMLKTFFVFLVIMILVGGILISMLVGQKREITKNCEVIDVSYCDRYMYYDKENEEFFFTKNSNWDLNALVVRKTIDYETGKIIKESNDQIVNAMKNIEDVLK